MNRDEWEKARREQYEALAHRHRERELLHKVIGTLASSSTNPEVRQAWCIWCGKPMQLPITVTMDRLCEDCVKPRASNT